MNDLILAPLNQIEVDKINLNLETYFGTEEGKPKYRVVWANEQFEIRKAQRAKFDIHGNFLGVEEGILRVPKYPMYKNLYVLERILFYTDPTGELLDTEKGTYEAIYEFTDYHGKYVHPIWEKCKKICIHLEAPKEKKSEQTIYDEMIAKRDKDAEQIYERLNDAGPSPSFYPGETGKQGVFIDSQKSEFLSLKEDGILFGNDGDEK